jgi:hypothetical protein
MPTSSYLTSRRLRQSPTCLRRVFSSVCNLNPLTLSRQIQIQRGAACFWIRCIPTLKLQFFKARCIRRRRYCKPSHRIQATQRCCALTARRRTHVLLCSRRVHMACVTTLHLQLFPFNRNPSTIELRGRAGLRRATRRCRIRFRFRCGRLLTHPCSARGWQTRLFCSKPPCSRSSTSYNTHIRGGRTQLVSLATAPRRFRRRVLLLLPLLHVAR